MKKPGIWIIILLVLLLGGCARPYIVTEDRTVQALHEKTVVYADGRTEKEEYLYEQADMRVSWPAWAMVRYENDVKLGQETLRWDELENLISAVPDWAEGVTRTYELTYDEAGQISTRIVLYDGVEVREEQYTYDGQGRETERRVYVAGQLQSRTTTEYGETGRRLKITEYDATDHITSWQTCEFYERTKVETVLAYDGAGKLQSRDINYYSVADVVIKQEHYDAEDNLLYTAKWRYVPHGMRRIVFL